MALYAIMAVDYCAHQADGLKEGLAAVNDVLARPPDCPTTSRAFLFNHGSNDSNQLAHEQGQTMRAFHPLWKASDNTAEQLNALCANAYVVLFTICGRVEQIMYKAFNAADFKLQSPRIESWTQRPLEAGP